MKINMGWHSPHKKLPTTEQATMQPIQPKAFSDFMHQQDDRQAKGQLQEIINQIEEQSERLNRSMTVRELRRYKILVKKFLEETARKGVGIKDTRGWDRRGRSKRYKLIEEVDRHLLEMTDQMLLKENGRVELLSKVGEIKGLLINLFY